MERALRSLFKAKELQPYNLEITSDLDQVSKFYRSER